MAKRKIEDAVKGPAPEKPWIDARTVLDGLDKESLAAQIAAAEKRFEDAKNELKALRTLEKIRAIKAGEFRFGPHKRKAAAAKEDPEIAIIVAFLAEHGASSVPEIVRGTGLLMMVVEKALVRGGEQKPPIFVCEGTLWEKAESEE